MPTFTWDKLTVHVGEMSRATALKCAREINRVAAVCTDVEEGDLQIDAIIAVHAPAIARYDGQVANGNGLTFEVDGNPVSIKLPLTDESYNALPLSLATAWSAAALAANGWLKEAAKNVVGRTMENSVEPPSGSGPSKS